jgi:hypothetical protein
MLYAQMFCSTVQINACAKWIPPKLAVATGNDAAGSIDQINPINVGGNIMKFDLLCIASITFLWNLTLNKVPHS